MRIVIAGATGTVGRHVEHEAKRRGHDTVALSRASGQDVTTGAGLAEAMSGADAVIDVSNQSIMNAAKAKAFFTESTRNLQAGERAAGVGHHIVLSIVGIESVDAAYYAGKLAQEQAVTSGTVAWSILRATQFHEFVGQVLAQGSFGPVAVVPTMLVRPIAAREVAQRLIEIAENGPSGRVTDLVGPREETLLDLVRRQLRHDGVKRRSIGVSLPGKYWRGVASGALRGSAASTHGQLTFDQWLDSADRWDLPRASRKE